MTCAAGRSGVPPRKGSPHAWSPTTFTPPSLRTAVQRHANLELLDLSRAPYVLYGVKYIDLVSLRTAVQRHAMFTPALLQDSARLFFRLFVLFSFYDVTLVHELVSGPKARSVFRYTYRTLCVTWVRPRRVAPRSTSDRMLAVC